MSGQLIATSSPLNRKYSSAKIISCPTTWTNCWMEYKTSVFRAIRSWWLSMTPAPVSKNHVETRDSSHLASTSTVGQTQVELKQISRELARSWKMNVWWKNSSNICMMFTLPFLTNLSVVTDDLLSKNFQLYLSINKKQFNGLAGLWINGQCAWNIDLRLKLSLYHAQADEGEKKVWGKSRLWIRSPDLEGKLILLTTRHLAWQ